MRDALHRARGPLLAAAALLTPAERRIVGFLVGWALLGLLASALPFRVGFSSDARAPVAIPPDDPRYPLHERSAALAAHLARARTPPDSLLDPNRASPLDLDRLPGLGPRIALRWAAVRDSAGPFLALSDLARVKGLGARKIQKLAPFLRFPALAGDRASERSDGLVDLNHASARELEDLPGVGPALAARIAARRSVRGRFRSLADLDSVPGVGPALLRRLAGRVRFE